VRKKEKKNELHNRKSLLRHEGELKKPLVRPPGGEGKEGSPVGVGNIREGGNICKSLGGGGSWRNWVGAKKICR